MYACGPEGTGEIKVRENVRSIIRSEEGEGTVEKNVQGKVRAGMAATVYARGSQGTGENKVRENVRSITRYERRRR